MNIFVLSRNPYEAAKMHCDKHIVKMPLETAQMLSTTLHNYGVNMPYKPVHKNHPCTKWVGENISNFLWTIHLGIALCNEYRKRYGKYHRSEQVIWYAHKYAHLLPNGEMTPFAQAMPEQYKHHNAVIAYRMYYKSDKKKFATYKNVEIPTFLI